MDNATTFASEDATSLEATLARRRANDFNAWPERGADSRLEPECWPDFKASFTLAKDASIFAIGSCFARNMEQHLKNLGFNVPSIDLMTQHRRAGDAISRGVFNVFTPAAILQELQWAHNILRRDDQVRESDVLPLLLQMGPDRYVDMHARGDAAAGDTLENHMANRRLLYSIHRLAFLSDVVIITLGYVESWWDKQTGQAIVFHTSLPRSREKDRFVFRRMRYAESYACIAEAVRLIQGGKAKNIMLTTSPVPLASTFTGDDVIIANTYSKSLLRTVSGDIAADFEGVDYVPSFEAVTLTKLPAVWEDDLVHVRADFVRRIMSFVTKRYVPDLDDSIINDIAAFSKAFTTGQHEKADELYPRIAELYDLGKMNLQSKNMLVGYLDRRGKAERARAVFNDALAEIKSEQQEPPTYLSFAKLAERIGETSAAKELRSLTISGIGRDQLWLHSLLTFTKLNNWNHETRWLLEQAEPNFQGHATGLTYIASAHKQRDDIESYRRVRSAALALNGTAQEIWGFSVELEKAGEIGAAIRVIENTLPRPDDDQLLRRVVMLLRRERRPAEAEAIIASRLAKNPDDSVALSLRLPASN